MNVPQMLAHAQVPLRCAFGELKLKRSLFGVLFGRMALKQMTSGKTVETRHADGSEFYHYGRTGIREGKETAYCSCAAIYAIGPSAITKDMHPFFGKMTPQQWSALQWNHLNHHLSQFEV